MSRSSTISKYLLGLGLGLSSSAYSIQPLLWTPEEISVGGAARAYTGTVQPLLTQLPIWARSNRVNLDVMTLNPALMTLLPRTLTRVQPISLTLAQAGDALHTDRTLGNLSDNTAEYLASIANATPSVQSARASLSAFWMERGWGLSIADVRDRLALHDTNNDIFFERHESAILRFSAGGFLFRNRGFGTLSNGISTKMIYRKGAEFKLNSTDGSNAIVDTDYSNGSLGLGFDYGFLWSSQVDEDATEPNWVLQSALVIRNLGTTPFFLGQAHLRPLPSVPVFGFGVSPPPVWGVRSAWTLEYREWSRRIGFFDKVSLASEIRLPVAASLHFGFSGAGLSSGLELRFPYVNVELASTVQVVAGGEIASQNLREYVVNLKAAF